MPKADSVPWQPHVYEPANHDAAQLPPAQLISPARRRPASSKPRHAQNTGISRLPFVGRVSGLALQPDELYIRSVPISRTSRCRGDDLLIKGIPITLLIFVQFTMPDVEVVGTIVAVIGIINS